MTRTQKRFARASQTRELDFADAVDYALGHEAQEIDEGGGSWSSRRRSKTRAKDSMESESTQKRPQTYCELCDDWHPSFEHSKPFKCADCGLYVLDGEESCRNCGADASHFTRA